MKLLFVHNRFGALAGAEANALATASELKRRGHEVGLLHGLGTGRGESDWNRAFAESAFPLTSKDKTSSALQALEKFDPDLIYVHNLSDLEVLEAILKSERPAVRMVHDHELYCMRSYKYNCVTRRICRRRFSLFCLFPCGAFLKRNRQGRFPLAWVSYRQKRKEILLNRRFDRLLVATKYMKEELLRNGFAADRIEIHPPVPPRGDPACQSDLGDRNLIVYAGQITRGKGVDVLLEALARIPDRFECLIFGDGHHRPYCEQLSRQLGLNGKVQFCGFISQEALRDYYLECSVALMSSVWPEPFGATGLEAMRYGVPVVAFDAGGIGEWLKDGDNGFLIPWMDRDQFAAKLAALLRDKPLARRLGQNGRRWVRERFDFAKYVDGLENLFTRMAAGAPTRSILYSLCS